MTKKPAATKQPIAVQLDPQLLHPYAAFQLYDCAPAPAPAQNLQLLAGEIATLLSSASSSSIEIVAQSQLPPGDITGWALHFKKTTQAPWTADQTVLDVEQHILVLVEHDLVLGMSTSASEVRDRVGQLLSTKAGLTAMPAKDLETAFLRSAQLRTLWLTGIHRRSPFKADSKVLMGSQLQTALSPLDDRTFRPSSGRADTGLAASTGLSKVGVSPKRSYAWIGPTTDFTGFASRYKTLIRHISAKRKMSLAPLPILAQALPKAPAAGTVSAAFDFAFLAPETAADLDSATKLLLEAFEARLSFTTTGNAADQNFTLHINDRDHVNTNRAQQDWVVDVTVALVGASATGDLATDSQGWPRLGAFNKLLLNRSLWSVWYDTRHSLGGGEWTMLDARASSFEGTIKAVDFTIGNWDIESEKPLPPNGGRSVVWTQIGADESLFSWWIRNGMAECFPAFNSATDPSSFAFVICDDGKNELADFIVMAKHHCFATPTNPSHLAFVMVHIKASSSRDLARDMAPKQYEEVLGQATKNLGRVQFPDTRQYLLGRLGRGVAMMWEWSAGQFHVFLKRGTKLPASSPVRTTLEVFNGQRHHVHVVVVQPHQRTAAFQVAMNNTPVNFKTHMLCTLLCATDGAARASSAKFSVVMSP